MDTISIDFDENFYFPGQTVTGLVIINFPKPVKAKHLTISIDGSARGAQKCQTVNYVKHAVTVWEANDNDDTISSGTNIFQFAFKLPLTCPPTFQGKYGSVRYVLHVEMSGKPGRKVEKEVIVMAHYDMSVCSVSNQSVKKTLIKRLVTLEAYLPRQGYLPNEVIPITIDIINLQPKTTIKSIRVHLYQSTTYYVNCISNLRPRETEIKQLEESKIDMDLAPETRKQIMAHLTVPNVSPTFKCAVIRAEYLVSVAITDNSSMFGEKLKLEIPVIIGSQGDDARDVMVQWMDPEETPILGGSEEVEDNQIYPNLEPSAPGMEHY